MTIVEWLKLIGVIVSIVAAFIGFHKGFKDRKRRDKEKHQALIQRLDGLETKIEERLDLLDEKIDDVQLARNRDERDRLRESILQFADRLRLKSNFDQLKVGTYVIDLTEFDIMFQNYKKYKSLGGNGYIDEEMKFITNEFKKIKKS